MKRSTMPVTSGLGLLCLLSLPLLMGANGGGCGVGLDNQPGVPGIDVGGVQGATWDVTYQDTLHVTVKSATGVVLEKDLSLVAGGTFQVDTATINLGALCDRGDVACPQDVFPRTVTMTQPGQMLHFLDVTFNRKGPFGAITQTTLVGNVDSVDDFAIALGVGGAAQGNCGLLGVSYANGHIDASNTTPPLGTSISGQIITAYTGACVVAGTQGAAGTGLTVELSLPFSATRR